MGAIISGFIIGFIAWFLVRYLAAGLFTVNQNERAVKTSFGRGERIGDANTLTDPISESLSDEEKQRYIYPQVRVIQPGGPYFKWPWEKVYKVPIATQTMNMAFDPESPDANYQGTILEAVTKDQLNTGLKGQIRWRASERNLYAYVFGVKHPITHVMAYFVSILRERIANFEAQAPPQAADNEPHNVAAINTAYNEVSSDISLAQAGADQKIVQSKRAVEIETLKAQAEVQPLIAMAEQLGDLKKSGAGALDSYIRNVRLQLYKEAKTVIMEASHE